MEARRPTLLGPPTPSHLVTEEMLNSWGFTVEVVGHAVGSAVMIRSGLSFEKAKHAAWVAGFTRLCSPPSFVATPPPKADPATVAWALSIRKKAS